MTKPEFKDLLKRYLRNDCTNQERLLVEAWYELLGTEQPMDMEEEADLEGKLWERIHGKTITLEKTEKESRLPVSLSVSSRARVAWNIAATFLFLISAGIAWFYVTTSGTGLMGQEASSPQKSLVNTSENPETYWLADSTKVELMPGTELHVLAAFASHDRREVQLKGVAFFDVKKNPNKPFLVHTGEVVTRVLGTSFRIVHTSEEEDIEVEVHTGKVSVYNKTITDKREKKNNGVVLTPNQKVTYYPKDQHFVTSVVPEPVLLEQAKIGKPAFQYEETPIEQILSDLEQNYGLHIAVDNDRFKDCPLTADLSEQTLFDKLEMICTSLGASYEIKGTTILISGRGCK